MHPKPSTHPCIECGECDDLTRHPPYWCFACTRKCAVQAGAGDRSLIWRCSRYPDGYEESALVECPFREIGVNEFEYEVWYIRVTHPATPAYVEWQRQPGGEMQRTPVYPRNMSLRDFDKANELLRQALVLPYGLTRSGGPSRTPFDSREELIAAVAAAIRGLKKNGRKVTLASVAEYFSNHSGFPNAADDGRNLRRWLRHKNWFENWEELRDAAEATLTTK